MMNMSKISPIAIVDPAWPMFFTSLERRASIVPARTNAAVTATLKDPGYRADHAGLDAGVDLFSVPGKQQQIVVTTHPDKDDERDRNV